MFTFPCVHGASQLVDVLGYGYRDSVFEAHGVADGVDGILDGGESPVAIETDGCRHVVSLTIPVSIPFPPCFPGATTSPLRCTFHDVSYAE